MDIEEFKNEYRVKFDNKTEIKVLLRKLLDLRSSILSGRGPYFLDIAKDDLPVWSDAQKRKFEKEHYSNSVEEVEK